jgi:hypothetical protein
MDMVPAIVVMTAMANRHSVAVDIVANSVVMAVAAWFYPFHDLMIIQR